jgi:NTP pyrophosphatase (non-canonical NTP hydrolase)
MKIQQNIKAFEKRTGWDKTTKEQIMKIFQKDAKFIKKGKHLKHKTLDVFFEIVQLANRLNINLEKDIQKHMKEAKAKYSK